MDCLQVVLLKISSGVLCIIHTVKMDPVGGTAFRECGIGRLSPVIC